MIIVRTCKERLPTSKTRSVNSREQEDEMKGKAGFMATLMEKWMKMSHRMAGAIDETQNMSSHLAPDATLEINGLFEEWLRTVEDEILDLLKNERSLKPSEIAAQLKISEKSVIFFIDKMKKEGRLKTA
jgi:hypothetical protein